jgi:hypothetical protein
MWEKIQGAFATILGSAEFWSAIAGAIVGGLIGIAIQLKVIWEAREQRKEDHERVQRALGLSLFFKMTKIVTNLHHLSRHIERCFQQAEAKGFKGDPWQFVLPLANFPEPVHFSADEMSMLLDLKNDKVFNDVISTDDVHNAMVEAAKTMSAERLSLEDRLSHDGVEGNVVYGHREEELAQHRPQIVKVNMLIELVRSNLKIDSEQSRAKLHELHDLLREKLGLEHRIAIELDQGDGAQKDGQKAVK